jgi:hypothetical protein
MGPRGPKGETGSTPDMTPIYQRLEVIERALGITPP